jgi:hypothetical protein
VTPLPPTLSLWADACQHAALKTKFHVNAEKVHTAFHKTVDQRKDPRGTEQRRKLLYLLTYLQLGVCVLREDKATHEPRPLEDLDTVCKYMVKIANPCLKRLQTESGWRRVPGHAALDVVGTSSSWGESYSQE